MATLYEDYKKKLSSKRQDDDSTVQPSEELIYSIMEMIEAQILTTKTKAKYSVEPLQLPRSPRSSS